MEESSGMRHDLRPRLHPVENIHFNTHHSEDVIERGLHAVSPAFRRCRMSPKSVPAERFGCNSLLYGEFGRERFLVYVRITVDCETETGTGPMPGLLVDAASELGAEPYVIRVHMTRAGQGVSFQYFGYDEFIDSVMSHSAEWNAQLIAPKSLEDFRRMLGRRVSQLCVEVDLNVEDEREVLSLRVHIDGKEPYQGTICPISLLQSTVRSDEHDIFTCTCGEAGCAGIYRGVIVVNDGPFTLWKAFYARGRRIFLFDREQYRREILEKCGEALRFIRAGENRWIVPYDGRATYFEKAFYEATEDALSPNPHLFSAFMETNR